MAEDKNLPRIVASKNEDAKFWNYVKEALKMAAVGAFMPAAALLIPVGLITGCGPDVGVKIEADAPAKIRPGAGQHVYQSHALKWMPAFLFEFKGNELTVRDASLGIEQSNTQFFGSEKYSKKPEDISTFMRANYRDSFMQQVDQFLPQLNLTEEMKKELTNNVYIMVEKMQPESGLWGGMPESYRIVDVSGVKIAACYSNCDRADVIALRYNDGSAPLLHEIFHDVSANLMSDPDTKLFLQDTKLFFLIGGETKASDMLFRDIINESAEPFVDENAARFGLSTDREKYDLTIAINSYITARFRFAENLVDTPVKDYKEAREGVLTHHFQFFVSGYDKLLPPFIVEHYKPYLSEKGLKLLRFQDNPYYADKESFAKFKEITEEFLIYTKAKMAE
ncbi:MAG: hypothetical protein V1492_05570 [Candidatus Micrarchaeota archaeon]